MNTDIPLQRIRDGFDTLIRELELENADGIPTHSDLTGVHSLEPTYSPNKWARNHWLGFFVGRLWLLSRIFPEKKYYDIAVKLCSKILKPMCDGPVNDENAAFDIFYALSIGYNITGKDEYRDVALRALDHLVSTYRHDANLFVCNTESNEVVIDTAGPLIGYLWAGQFDPWKRELLKTHMDRILDLGLLPDTGEAFQGVELSSDSREIVRYFARQGYRPDSHWTRAQAWAIHNYLNGFEATHDRDHLAASLRAADWFWSKLPVGLVNYYDYDDPRGAEIPLDTCSSIMAANSFIRYGRIPDVENRSEWHDRGCEILDRVFKDHVTLGGVVLHGSWGNARERGLGSFPQQDIMCYGNYFFVEALYRLHCDDWAALDLRGR